MSFFDLIGSDRNCLMTKPDFSFMEKASGDRVKSFSLNYLFCMMICAIVSKLWNYCNVLRDDGMSYGDYVEQLTALTLALSQRERE
jgi:hypothetical protein